MSSCELLALGMLMMRVTHLNVVFCFQMFKKISHVFSSFSGDRALEDHQKQAVGLSFVVFKFLQHS